MLELLSKYVHWISSPLVHVPILIFIGWTIKKFTNKSIFGNLLMATSIFWFFFCSLTYTSVLLVHNLEHRYEAVKLESDKWRDVEAIVVLACYFYDDENLPFVSKWPNCSLQRNLQAALMFREKSIPIYVSGGLRPGADTTYAYQNAQFMLKLGVPESSIFIIPEGYNTQTETFALSKALSGKKIALVTSASHIQRAKYYFEKADMDVLPIPVEFLSEKDISPEFGLPNATSLYRSERAIYEYLGLTYQSFFAD